MKINLYRIKAFLGCALVASLFFIPGPSQAQVVADTTACAKEALSADKVLCYQDAIDNAQIQINTLRAQMELYGKLMDEPGPDEGHATSALDDMENVDTPATQTVLECAVVTRSAKLVLYDDEGRKIGVLKTSKSDDRNVYAVGDVQQVNTPRVLLVEAKEHSIKGQANGTAVGYVDMAHVKLIDAKYCERVTPEMIYWPGA